MTIGKPAQDADIRPPRSSLLVRYAALLMWIRGRNDHTGTSNVVFASTSGTLTLPLAFAVATGIEIVVLHLLIPWLWLQIVLAAVSLWSLLELFCMLAVDRTQPHVLVADRAASISANRATSTGTDRGDVLVLRRGGKVVGEIPCAVIASVSLRTRYCPTEPSLSDEHLYLPNQDGSVIDLVLSEPVEFHVDSMFVKWRYRGPACAVSLHVDDPRALQAAVSRS
ncbi:MAG: hypothetical protein GX542_07835 [Rhodococcus sp.]|nr:hypothetical protein [Rhodococcus sp. (in: high G+C Gram-positive bacteria)]